MAIENNLPIIFDVATQTEDGLMSFQDKIKLDKMEDNLGDKLTKFDKIPSSQLDISSDEAKIQPENLSDAVKQMMTGQTAVSGTVPNNGVTTEKIANEAVTIDKLDKRILLGNIVSDRPLNFVFDDKRVAINVPKGTLLLIDAMTKRYLVTGCDIDDVLVNINYPTEFDGLNYIISAPTGTLTMVNHRKANTINSVNSIVALVSITTTFEASIVMSGNYTINGLARGIGTESAALMGNGKIVFDKLNGIVDFTNATALHLIVGGVFNRTIENQTSIRIANYTEDAIYTLYWDNATSSLKIDLAINSDTDITKIALIKDGRIIPFVDTGIFYSKPYMEAPYYTEYLETINNILIASKEPLNILKDEYNKIEIPAETYVCLNQQKLLVANQECYYADRQGLHYILFNLDDNTLSCRYSNDEEVEGNNIVVGTIWSETDYILVSGDFEYTIEGIKPYENDLAQAQNDILAVEEIIKSSVDIKDNLILSSDDVYMIEGEELPVYSSSMMVKTAEGIKTAISYNKNNDIMSPRTEFFDGDILLNDPIGDTVSLLAYDKYNGIPLYQQKDITINKVAPTIKEGQRIKILCLGDDLIGNKVAYYVKNKLTSLGVVPEMIGTMVNDQVYGEGRDGWFYSTFVGASGRGLKEGKINPQTVKGDSSIFLNPFMRVANADDKANNPNDCYRATGAYVEKNYYNDTDKNGAFYIFDFAKYLEVQAITDPDVIVIAVKPELVNVFTEDVVSTNMIFLRQLVNGIRKALPDTYIALVPQYNLSTLYDDMWMITSEMIVETIDYVNGLNDDKVKVIPSWLHMNREFGTEGLSVDSFDPANILQNGSMFKQKLTENAKIELANSITAFIMNI